MSRDRASARGHVISVPLGGRRGAEELVGDWSALQRRTRRTESALRLTPLSPPARSHTHTHTPLRGPVVASSFYFFDAARGTDLHMAQRILLSLTVSCSSKIQIGFAFLVPADLGTPRKRDVKRVCVCTTCTSDKSLRKSHY